MGFNFTIRRVLLILLLLTSTISLALSAVALFLSPSKNSSNQFLEINTSNSNITNIYPIPENSSDTEVSLQSVYRFGLWGYCTGEYPIIFPLQVQGSQFLETECTSPKARYQPDIVTILISSFRVDGQFSEINLNKSFDSKPGKFITGFNGICAGFILSVILSFIVVVLTLAESFNYLPEKFEIYSWCLLLFTAFAQWIALVVGLASIKQAYDKLYHFVVVENSSWNIEAIKNYESLKFGWASLAFGIVSSLISIAGIVNCFNRDDSTKIVSQNIQQEEKGKELN